MNNPAERTRKIKYGIVGAVATAFCVVGIILLYRKLSTDEVKSATKLSSAPAPSLSSLPNQSVSSSERAEPKDLKKDIENIAEATANTTEFEVVPEMNSKRDSNESFSPKSHPNIMTLFEVPGEYGEAFISAHMEFIETVCAIGQRDSRTEKDDLALEEKFAKAKSLFTSQASKNKDLVERVYKNDKWNDDTIYEVFLSDPFLRLNCIPTETIIPSWDSYMVMVYKSFHMVRLLCRAPLQKLKNGLEKLTFLDYTKEHDAFTNAYYLAAKNILDFIARKMIKEEMKKPEVEQQLERIMDWLRSLNLSSRNLSRATFNKHTANNIKSVADLLKFTYEPDINQFLQDHFQNRNIPALYDDAKSAFNFPPVDEFLEKYYTPVKPLPVKEAVLSTPPRKIVFQSTCFASCYFQIMTNFLPLMKHLPGWNSKPTQDAPAHQQIFEQLSVKGDPLSIKEFIQLPIFDVSRSNPLTMVADYVNGFEPEGLPMNQLLGFSFNNLYFPIMRYLPVTPGFPEAQNVMMIGQLLVTWISDEGDLYDPVDLPLQLSLNFLGCAERKRYELYGFGLKQKMSTPHIMAFVKRATGVWYECDCLKGKADAISEDHVPYTAARQALISKSLKQRPEMAVYLRTEE